MTEVTALQEKLLRQIKALPIEEQKAILWLIEQMDALSEMAAAEPLNQEWFDRTQNEALERKDYYTLAMLYFQLYKSQEKEDDK